MSNKYIRLKKVNGQISERIGAGRVGAGRVGAGRVDNWTSDLKQRN